MERRDRRDITVQPAAMLMRSFGVGVGLQRADLVSESLRREGISVGSQARMMVLAEEMAIWLSVEGRMVRVVVRWEWNCDWRALREEELRTVAMKEVGRGVLVLVVSVVVVGWAVRRPLRMAMPIFPGLWC